MRLQSLRLLLSRTRNRGLDNTLRMLNYHIHYFVRYNTPTKMVNFAIIKAQKWLRVSRVLGMPYRYFIDPTNICNLRCPVCPTGLGILGRAQGMIGLDRFKMLVDQIAK